MAWAVDGRGVRPRLDIVEMDGVWPARAAAARAQDGRRESGRRFLSVWFRCCHAYGRLSRNRQATRYEGRCPCCGSCVSARIGPEGTTRRVFVAE
jgi:hypothetical protein